MERRGGKDTEHQSQHKNIGQARPRDVMNLSERHFCVLTHDVQFRPAVFIEHPKTWFCLVFSIFLTSVGPSVYLSVGRSEGDKSPTNMLFDQDQESDKSPTKQKRWHMLAYGGLYPSADDGAA